MPRGKRTTDAMRRARRSGVPVPADREKYRDRDQDAADTLVYIRAFVDFRLHLRRSVPWEIQRLVAKAFERYLEQDNKTTLDEAFRLTGRQRSGHPVEANRRRAHYVRAMLEIARLQVVDGLTIEKAVAKVVEHDSELKEEILLKEYKAHGVGKSLRDAIAKDRKDRAED